MMTKHIIGEPLFSYSRNLRTKQTPWESRLWYYLRGGRFYGLKFKRQVVIGRYIVDFSCREKMVVIELDGAQHSESVQRDRMKDTFLQNEGYHIVRVWNNEIDNNVMGVLEKIKMVCGV